MIYIIRKPKFRIAQRDPVRFTCSCGCVFDADRTDYHLTTRMNAAHIDRGQYYVQCPACGARCFSNEAKEETNESTV